MTTLLGLVFPWTGRERAGGMSRWDESAGGTVEIGGEREKQQIHPIEIPPSLDLERIKAECQTA